MTAIDELASEQSGPIDPMTAAERLTALLDLSKVGLSVRGARVVGRGSGASADLHLSDGTEINFPTLRDAANATRLAVEIAACTGATPRLKAPQAIQVVALIRALAEHQHVLTVDDLSIEWGLAFLQAADVLDIDLSDQGHRWDAFSRLEAIDPLTRWRSDGISIAKASLILRDTDGVRLVRAGWFRAHVRADDHQASPQEIAHRMERVGWRRPGRTGRIKATQPGFNGTLAWSFYAVPPAWEAER